MGFRNVIFRKHRVALAAKPAAHSPDFSVGSFDAVSPFSRENAEMAEPSARSSLSLPLCLPPLRLKRGFLARASHILSSFPKNGARPSFSKPSFSKSEAFLFGLRRAESALSTVASFPLFGGAIPLLVLLSCTLCICAPTLQNRFGLYFLERKISFDSDGAAYSAMNSLLNAGGNFSASETALIGGEGARLPAFDIPEPVAYSNYTVRGGDTISGIALRFSLDNIGTILSANEIENARRISTGQQLRIPSMDGLLYKAVSGDSLQSIASKFSAPLEAILDANDLEDSLVAVGQEIFIPGAKLSTYDLRKAMGELFIYPISGRLTSRYGMRNDPFTGARTFHTGVDLAAPTGTSIKASTDGSVAAAGWHNIYGNYAIVTHAGGYQTLYAHMSSLSVKRGQYLEQGDEVGKVGSTGYSTGSHLHFSVYKNGKTIDPFSVLD